MNPQTCFFDADVHTYDLTGPTALMPFLLELRRRQVRRAAHRAARRRPIVRRIAREGGPA